MTGWQVQHGVPVRVHFRPEFVQALRDLTRERGGGYIPLAEVEARAEHVVIIKPLPLPPLPLPLPLPPLPLPVLP